MPHTPIPFFSTPDLIASPNPNVTDDTPIDLVFVDFIESVRSIFFSMFSITLELENIYQYQDVLSTVTQLWNKTVTSADVQTYSPILASQVFGVFAQQKWN